MMLQMVVLGKLFIVGGRFFFFLPDFFSPSKSAHQTSFRLFLNFDPYVFYCLF